MKTYIKNSGIYAKATTWHDERFLSGLTDRIKADAIAAAKAWKNENGESSLNTSETGWLDEAFDSGVFDKEDPLEVAAWKNGTGSELFFNEFSKLVHTI